MDSAGRSAIPSLARLTNAVIIVAGALLLGSCTLQPDVSQATPNGRVGTKAPALSGETLTGAALTIDFHQAKTVLVFWAAWCGPCRAEQPGLNTLAARYAGFGIRFYGVDMLDHDRALARAFSREFNVAYPSLYDDSGTIAAAYEVDSPPSFVLVDQRGIVVGRYPGEASSAQLATLIDQKLLTDASNARSARSAPLASAGGPASLPPTWFSAASASP